MLATVDAALAEPEQEPVVPEGETSLQLLQAIYRDKRQPLNVRVRCAIESLPFEVPKLSATAIATMDGQSFAEALERACARSETARLGTREARNDMGRPTEPALNMVRDLAYSADYDASPSGPEQRSGPQAQCPVRVSHYCSCLRSSWRSRIATTIRVRIAQAKMEICAISMTALQVGQA